MDINYFVSLYTKRFRKRRGMKDTPRLDMIRNIFSDLLPKYYKLVDRIINKSNVYFSIDYDTKVITKYNKRFNRFDNVIHLKDGEGSFAFFHELGHAFDSYNTSYYATSRFITSTGKTVYETVADELNKNKEALLNIVLKSFENELDMEEGETTYKLLMSYTELINKADKLSLTEHDDLTSDRLFYRNMRYTDLYKTPHYDEYISLRKYINKNKIYQKREEILNTEAYKRIDRKYHIIVDLLSSKYDMNFDYLLTGHNEGYYKEYKERLSGELLANFIGFKLIGDKEPIRIFKRLLPNSYKALIEAANNQIKLIMR